LDHGHEEQGLVRTQQGLRTAHQGVTARHLPHLGRGVRHQGSKGGGGEAETRMVPRQVLSDAPCTTRAPLLVVLARHRAAVQAQADEACAVAYLVAVSAVQGQHAPVAVAYHDLRPVVEGHRLGHERPRALLLKPRGQTTGTEKRDRNDSRGRHKDWNLRRRAYNRRC
jgi:hypothetical protein